MEKSTISGVSGGGVPAEEAGDDGVSCCEFILSLIIEFEMDVRRDGALYESMLVVEISSTGPEI